MPDFSVLSCRPHLGLTLLVIGLSLAGCASWRGSSRLDIPPPPAALHDLEEPARRSPLLASRLVEPRHVSPEKELLTLFEHWREAWMMRNFDAYLTHYAAAFSGSGTPALRWQTRRLRMVQGKTDQAVLRFGQPNIELESDGRAVVSFSQHFEDGELSEIGTKQWQLRQINGRWLIEQEIFERGAP